MTFSESTTIQFLLTISKSIGAVCTDESMRQLWKQFRWWILSRQWLSFPWLFLTQQGLSALTNPCVTCGSSFGDDFESVVTQFSLTISEPTGAVCADESMCQLWKQFRWWFLSQQRLSFSRLFLTQQGLCALTNPCITCGCSFLDNFWVGNDSVFLDYFWITRGYVRWWINVSPVEAISVTISESAATFFSLTICESTWAVCDDESMRQLWNQFRYRFLSRQWRSFPRLFLSQQGLCALTNSCVISGSSFSDDFWVSNDSVFLDSFCVNRCVGRQIQASAIEVVWLTIFASA